MNANSNNTTSKAGTIIVKQGKRGIELHAFNHERQRMTHVGTVIAQVYEKGHASILRKPEPSISLPQSEYGAAINAGARFLRCIPPDKSCTYAIALSDFKTNAIPYYNSSYGPQLRVSLTAFERASKVSKRNAVIDNPVIEVERPLIKQMDLFR